MLPVRRHAKQLTEYPGEAKIAQLDDVVVSEQDVFRLHVPVDAVVLVAEVDPFQQLVDDLLRQLLGNTSSRKKDTGSSIFTRQDWKGESHPLGFLSSSLSTVRSQYSKTRWSFLFLLKTSSRLTRFGCFSC